MTNRKHTVIFDIGAVKLGLNYGKDENSFFAQASRISGLNFNEFKAWYSIVEKKCLTGDIDAKEHYRLLREKLKQPNMPQRELEALVGLLWTGPINSTIELGDRIHNAGYAIGILSNMTDYCFSIISEKHPEVFETFGGKKVFSFEHGTIKPDLRLYRQFNDALGMKVYIDDNLRYASAPLVLPGWFGIHYTELVDPSEGVRQVQDKSAENVKSDRLFVANSAKELEQVLRCLGIKI